MGSGCVHKCVCVHAARVLHGREPHGALALLTHHMQGRSHQQGSVAGCTEEGTTRAEGAVTKSDFSLHFFAF